MKTGLSGRQMVTVTVIATGVVVIYHMWMVKPKLAATAGA